MQSNTDPRISGAASYAHKGCHQSTLIFERNLPLLRAVKTTSSVFYRTCTKVSDRFTRICALHLRISRLLLLLLLRLLLLHLGFICWSPVRFVTMSELQRSFARAQLAKLPPEAPLIFDEREEDEEDANEMHARSASDSSASSTGTIVPSPTKHLFERSKR